MIDFDALGIFPIGSIVVICFLVGMVIKSTGAIDNLIPAICGTSGGVLGLAWYLCGWPGIVAQEPVTATAIGIVSGLAATGIDQLGKQLGKYKS